MYLPIHGRIKYCWAEMGRKVLKSVLGMIPSTNFGQKVLYLVLGNHKNTDFDEKVQFLVLYIPKLVLRMLP